MPAKTRLARIPRARDPACERIWLAIMALNNWARWSDLYDILGLSAPTLGAHLRHLIKDGLVRRNPPAGGPGRLGHYAIIAPQDRASVQFAQMWELLDQVAGAEPPDAPVEHRAEVLAYSLIMIHSNRGLALADAAARAVERIDREWKPELQRVAKLAEGGSEGRETGDLNPRAAKEWLELNPKRFWPILDSFLGELRLWDQALNEMALAVFYHPDRGDAVPRAFELFREYLKKPFPPPQTGSELSPR